jgi:hypothetical protein
MARLSREEFDELVVNEPGPFELAIRGHSALEAEINAALDGPIPATISSKPRRERPPLLSPHG